MSISIILLAKLSSMEEILIWKESILSFYISQLLNLFSWNREWDLETHGFVLYLKQVSPNAVILVLMLIFNHKCLVKEFTVRNSNNIQTRYLNPAHTNCKKIKLFKKWSLRIKGTFFFQYFHLSKHYCHRWSLWIKVSLWELQTPSGKSISDILMCKWNKNAQRSWS